MIQVMSIGPKAPTGEWQVGDVIWWAGKQRVVTAVHLRKMTKADAHEYWPFDPDTWVQHFEVTPPPDLD